MSHNNAILWYGTVASRSPWIGTPVRKDKAAVERFKNNYFAEM